MPIVGTFRLVFTMADVYVIVEFWEEMEREEKVKVKVPG